MQLENPKTMAISGIIDLYKRDDPAVLVTPRIATPEASPMHVDNTPNPIPYGYCHCGCGEMTRIARQTDTKHGLKRGYPNRFLLGHATRGKSFGHTPNEYIYIDLYTVRVQLNRGFSTIIDASRLQEVLEHHWFAVQYNTRHYVAANVRLGPCEWKGIDLHRMLMGFPEGMLVDHIDGDGLNNRSSNMRVATSAQNLRNQGIRSDNTSGFKGVSWSPPRNRWYAYIQVDGKKKHLGVFSSSEDAAFAYDIAARELFGEFARLNFPDGCGIP